MKKLRQNVLEGQFWLCRLGDSGRKTYVNCETRSMRLKRFHDFVIFGGRKKVRPIGSCSELGRKIVGVESFKRKSLAVRFMSVHH